MTGKVRRGLFVVLSLGMLLVLLAVDLHYLDGAKGYETQDVVLERVIKKELAREQSLYTDVQIFDSITLGDCYVAAYKTTTEPTMLGIMPFTLRKGPDAVTVKVRGLNDNTMICDARDKGDGIWEDGIAFYQGAELYQYAIFLSENPKLSYVEWTVGGTVYHLPVAESPSMTVVQWAPYPKEELASFTLMGYQAEGSFLKAWEKPSGGMYLSTDGMPEHTGKFSFAFFTAKGERLGMAMPCPEEEADRNPPGSR